MTLFSNTDDAELRTEPPSECSLYGSDGVMLCGEESADTVS